MTLKTPQVLLLDVMDTVVVDPFFADDFGEVIGCARSELLAQMTPDLWPQFERGELSAEVYYSRFFRDGRGVDGPRLDLQGEVDGVERRRPSSTQVPVHHLLQALLQ